METNWLIEILAAGLVDALLRVLGRPGAARYLEQLAGQVRAADDPEPLARVGRRQ